MLALDDITCLGDALRDAVLTARSATALIEVDRRSETRRMTYRDVRLEAESVAAALAAHEVVDGARVAIVMSNQSRWLTAAIGAFWAGAIVVPIDYKLTAAEQAAVLRHADPLAVITEWPVWRSLRDELDRDGRAVPPFTIVTGASTTDEAAPAQRWEDIEAHPFEPRSRRRDDVACIVYSSGTGGAIKGCMLTHSNYLAQAQSLGKLYPMVPGDTYFSILPTNHAIDFMCGFLMPLMFGATVVHQRTLRPEYLRFTMQRYGVTHMAVVPLLLRAFEQRIRERLDGVGGVKRAIFDASARLNSLLTMAKPRAELSRALLKPIHDQFGGRLKFVFAGGAFVEPELAEFFYGLGIPVVIGYGLTEAGTVLTVNDLRPFRPDTVGRPVDGVELEIRNPNEAGVGEVWARSPTVMAGYFRDDELSAETIVDGWLRTGDLGWIDPAEHLHLVGRLRNMIVTDGGKNIYPEDIEAALGAIEGIEELCVFAADYVWPRLSMVGETLVAVVRPVEGGGDWRPTLMAKNGRLADFKRINGVVVWDDAFPRTASMKVKREALAALVRDRRRREEVVSLRREVAEPPHPGVDGGE